MVLPGLYSKCLIKFGHHEHGGQWCPAPQEAQRSQSEDEGWDLQRAMREGRLVLLVVGRDQGPPSEPPATLAC